MGNCALTPLEMLVITQYATSLHLCYLLITVSLIRVTPITLFSTIISLFWASLHHFTDCSENNQIIH